MYAAYLTNPVICVIIFFFLSLIGAFVLFKFFKSTAAIQKKEYQAGGAIAGFIIIFILLWEASISLQKNIAQVQTPKDSLDVKETLWKIEGSVQKDDSTLTTDVLMSYIPKSWARPLKNGSFTIHDVRFTDDAIRNLKSIDLSGECKGYSSNGETYVISRDLEILPEEKKIKLKKPYLLMKDP